jgi:NitT/TauT family transport system substrate-binding protein
VISNQVDIGGLPPEAVINADSRGANAVMLGAFIQKAIGRVTTTPSINKVEDLKGKTAVVSGLGSIEDTSFKRLMTRAGLDAEKDISFVVVKDLPAELAAVKAGQAQAYLAIPPGELLGERAGLHVIFDVESLNLPYSQAAIFGTRAYLDKNRPTALALMQATTEGLAKMKNEPAYALDTFIKYSKIEDKEIAQRGVEWAIKTLGQVPSVNDEALKAVLDNVVKTNQAAANTDLKKVADTSLTDEISKSGLIDKLYKS